MLSGAKHPCNVRLRSFASLRMTACGDEQPQPLHLVEQAERQAFILERVAFFEVVAAGEGEDDVSERLLEFVHLATSCRGILVANSADYSHRLHSLPS